MFSLDARAVDAYRGSDIAGAAIGGGGNMPPGSTTLTLDQAPTGYDFMGWFSDNTSEGGSYNLLGADTELNFDLQGNTKIAAMFAPPLAVSVTADPPSVYRGQPLNVEAKANLGEWIDLEYDFSGSVSRTSKTGKEMFMFDTLGEKTIDVTATDPKGREAKGTVKVNVYNVAPSVALSAPPKITETKNATFIASGSDPEADLPLQFRFRLAEGPWSLYSTSPSWTLAFRGVGLKKLEVQAKDALSAQSEVFSLDINVTPRDVYMFGNYYCPISTTASYYRRVDYSRSMSTEFRAVAMSIGAREALNKFKVKDTYTDQTYGSMFNTIVVIDSDGELIGTYDTRTVDSGAQYYASYNAMMANYGQHQLAKQVASNGLMTLPDGQKVDVSAVYMNSPLIIDWDASGSPDLLAGTQWETPRALSPDLSNYRMVDLDNKGKSWWEWVGGGDPLLIDMEQAAKSPDAVGRFVFGNHTWGKQWGDGFSALRELDSDGSGMVDGAELSKLGLWFDKNSNATIDSGEAFSAADAGLTSIKARADSDSPEGNYMAKGGAVAKGNFMTVWDWWAAASPMGFMRQVGSLDWKKGPVNPAISPVVKLGGAEDGSLPMADGGRLTFYRNEAGDWFVRAQSILPSGEQADFIYPADVSDGVCKWGLESEGTRVSNVLIWGAGKLVGVTSVTGGRYSTWEVVGSSGETPMQSSFGIASR